MSEIWTIISGAFNETPAWLGAMLLGWLLSWGATQTLKFFIPVKWEMRTRRELAQGLAFFTAFVTVMVMAPMPLWKTVALACATGFWSPISFALLMAFIRKRWPYLADILTQDVRGVLFGERAP